MHGNTNCYYTHSSLLIPIISITCKIISFPECFTQADVCFIIDSSGSIRDANPDDGSQDNWMLILTFVTRVISAFKIGEQDTRVGVVTFSNDPYLSFGMNTYYDRLELNEGVRKIGYIGGTTNTAGALQLARTQCFDPSNGERPGIENIAIVITDGLPTVMEGNTNSEAQNLKQIATVLAVGITDNVEENLLRDISSPPQVENQNYFSAPDFSSLDSILRVLIRETCTSPDTGLPVPPPTTAPGIDMIPTNIVYLKHIKS